MGVFIRFRTLLLSISLALIGIATARSQSTSSSAPDSKYDWVYLEGNDLRVGLLRSHGGAIAYLSPKGSDRNVLDHYDHGRLVQQSYYGDEDGSLWAKEPWRYNPVQGGDYHGKASVIKEFTSTTSSAFVRTIPRHWASGKLLEECQMEQWLELNGPVLQVRFRFSYGGNESHKARHQETPAIFVAPRLKTLVYYSGKHPWKQEPLSHRIPQWPNEYVALDENWAAYLDDNNEGVGVYVPGAAEATCYRFPGDSACSYVAPLHTFALTPQLIFEYQAYLTLGDPNTIRKRFQDLKEHEAENPAK